MAHGWDPYLRNLSSLTSEHGTPETEVSHPRPADDLIGHDGFSSATVSDEVSATNTNYYFSPSIGNTNSDWSRETGNFQRHYREMTWQAGGEQKEYLPRWENRLTNLETGGHCPFEPDFEGLKQDCAIPTVAPYFENYLDVSSSTDREVGKTRSSCEFMTSASVLPKTDVTSNHCSPDWLQNCTENVRLSTDYAYPNTEPSLTKGNIMECGKDGNKRSEHDGFFSADMISHIQSETLKSGEDHQTWKQEEFVCHMSHEGNICPSGNLSDTRMKENHGGNEAQITEDLSCIINTKQSLTDSRDASEIDKTEKPDLVETEAFGEKGKNAQMDSPNKESHRNTFYSSGLQDESVSKDDPCQIGKQNCEEVVSPLSSKTLSQENMTSDPVGSDLIFNDACETSNHSKSSLNVVSQYQEKDKETAETIDCRAFSEQVCKSPTAISEASHIESDVNPHLAQLAASSHDEANIPFQNVDVGASAFSSGRVSLFNINDNKDQSDLSTKGLEMEQESPVKKTSNSVWHPDNVGVLEKEMPSQLEERVLSFNQQSTHSSSLPQSPEEKSPPDQRLIPETPESASSSLDQHLLHQGPAKIHPTEQLQSDNVGVHREQILEKERPSQYEERVSSFDQQSIASLSSPQSPEQIYLPDQTIMPKTPENMSSSLDQDLLHQGPAKIHLSDQLQSDNVGVHRDPLLEKERPSQYKERVPSFDQQSMDSLSSPQSPEEIYPPDQTIMPETPENMNSSQDQDLLHQSPEKTHLSEQLQSDKVGVHRDPLLEKERPSQYEDRVPSFDQQSMDSPSSPQSPEEIAPPEQTIMPKTPENMSSSLDQDFLHQGPEKTHHSRKDTTSPLEQLSLHQSAENTFDQQQSLSQDTVHDPCGEPMSRRVFCSDKNEMPALDLCQFEKASIGKAPELKSSSEMLKQLQPIVLLKTLEPVDLSKQVYTCAGCMCTTSNRDHLIEHHHLEHLMHCFQLCKTCGVYLSTDQSKKHVCGEITYSPKLSSLPGKRTDQSIKHVGGEITYSPKLSSVPGKRTDQTRKHVGGEITYSPKLSSLPGKRTDQSIKHVGGEITYSPKLSSVPGKRTDQTKKHVGGEITYSPKLSSVPGKRKKVHHCQKCGLCFLHKNHYISHMRTHTGKTPFRCNKCGYYFAQSSTLRRHTQISGRCGKNIPVRKPAVKSQKGDEIDKSQKSYKKMLNCYVKLHDISKTPFCKFCGKCFMTEVNAKKHVYNVHMRPDKEASISECKAHTEKTVQEYSEKKKYKCPLCPQIFKHFLNRARHLRECVKDVTFGVKNKVGGRYQCPLCLSTFSLATNRYRHIRTFCLRNFLQLLRQKQSKSNKTSQTINQTETVLDKLKAEEEQLNGQSSGNVTSQRVPEYKCNFCPAMFFYPSGKYRHMKKHKVTGQVIRYRHSLVKETAQSEYTRTVEGRNEQDSFSLRCKFCDRSFGSSHSLEKHEYTHQGETPYRCLECGKRFKKQTYLISHKVIHQRRIQCTVCRKILPTIGELIKHRQTHLKRGLLQCPDCPLQFKYPVYLLRHLPTHHKSKNKPPRDDQNQETLDSVQAHDATTILQCSLCKEVFDDSKLLRSHTLTHIRTSSPPQCPFCQRRFIGRRSLLRHMTRHSGGKQFSCKQCGKQFYKDSNLKIHSEKCWERKRALVCHFCSRTFLRSLDLEKHYRGHENKTLVPCKTCNWFYGASKISNHQKGCQPITETDSGSTSPATNQPNINNVPSNLRKFKCEYCPQAFKYRSLYLRHKVSHTGVQPYSCLRCGHNFPSQTKCLQHEAICDGVYSGEQSRKAEHFLGENTSEYKCKFCNKTFAKSRNLRRHILTHNEVNPYRCKACDSCFSRYDHLKVHQSRCKGKMRLRPAICIPKISLDQVGTGWQRDFGFEHVEKLQTLDCKECGKSFATKSKLTWHISMFHTVKQFKCSQCGSFFSNEKSIKKHINLRKCRLASIVKSNGFQNISQMQPTTSISFKNRVQQRIQPRYNAMYKFKCNFCPRTFQNKTNLKVHVYLHTGEKPFVCECGEKFIRKDYLQRHIVTCVSKRPQSVGLCEKCGVFFPKSKLENHKSRCRVKPSSSQLAELPSQSPPHGFSCAYCSSRFLLFSQLQEHFLNAHTLETMDPPVKTSPLQQHLSNIQTIREKPLDDSDPSMSLTSSKSNIPFKSEAGQTGTRLKESPFACQICKRGYWNKTLLRKHFRKCKRNLPEKKESQQADVPLRADIDLALTDSSADDSPEEYLESTELQGKSSQEKKPVVYQCSECDKSFTDGLLLISHLEDHGREEEEKRHNKCTKCGKVFASQANLAKHLKIHESDQLVCTDCSTALSSKSELEIHRKECHDPSNPYTCRLCNYTFKTKVSFCDHCTKEHPNDVFSCHLCKRSYTLRTSLIRHYRDSHSDEQLGQAEKSSSSQSTSESDYNDEHESDTSSEDSDSAPYFPCHVCGKTFSTSESLEDHQRCHLGEKPHECAECGQCFFLAAQLQQHQRKHKSEFQCKICGRGFVSLFTLRKHKHTPGKNRPFQCSKCHLFFKRSSQLAEHMHSHREENFPCDICNRVFLSKSSRAEHRKFHLPNLSDRVQTAVFTKPNKKPSSFLTLPTNEFKYRCGVCCERFRDPEELSEHGCMADIERRYSCLDCDKHFLHPSHLQKHIRTHKQSWSQSEYPCNHCNNSFSSPHEFLNHLQSHDYTSTDLQGSTADGGEGFICPICHQCFASAPELVSHFPMHPDGAFQCRVCNIAFPTARDLKEHEVSHVNESTETKCTKCGQCFLGKDAFSKHNCSQKRGIMDTKYSDIKQPKDCTFGDEDEIDVTGEDLCCCSFCPMRFSSKSHLLEHQNTEHPKENPYTCELCGKTFAVQNYLNRHLKRHSQRESAGSTSQEVQRKYWCAQCHSEFDTAKDLSLHLRLHVAEKEVGEHRCDMCYKSFSQLRLLRLHQESHVGQVVYECTECDKAFAFPHLLEEHQQSHAR